MRRLLYGLVIAGFANGDALAAPCAGFVDVDDSNAAYCAAVTYVKNKGITLGCTDASHYCPNDYVTRLQMALFLERAGKGNAANTLVDSTATIGGGGASGTQLSLPTHGLVDCTYPAGGPCANRVTDVFGTIAGGVGNQAGDASGAVDSAAFATVGGGWGNTVSGIGSTVAGGVHNTATGGSIAGSSTVSGGNSNTASGSYSIVAGGFGNLASGASSTVGGGTYNTASGSYSIVAGGTDNVASGNFAVAAGLNNVASGQSSVAMGQYANAGAAGCFVFADAVSDNATNCQTNTFVARATGGVYFITSGTSQANYNGLYVPAGGGAWVVFSDSNYKENVAAVSGRDVLERVVNLPISTWNWRTQPASVRHMGPTAQDFYAAFGLGDSDKGISTVDPDGVALAAIQGLYADLKDRDATIAEQQREIAELRKRVTQVESLRGELAALRNAIAAATSGVTVAAQVNATTP